MHFLVRLSFPDTGPQLLSQEPVAEVQRCMAALLSPAACV